MKILIEHGRFPHGEMPIINAKDGDFSVKFADRGREAQCEPNPAFPLGMDVDASDGNSACWGSVPPAPRCGIYVVHCIRCGFTAGFTMAGRADDLVRFKLPCADQGAVS